VKFNLGFHVVYNEIITSPSVLENSDRLFIAQIRVYLSDKHHTEPNMGATRTLQAEDCMNYHHVLVCFFYFLCGLPNLKKITRGLPDIYFTSTDIQ